MNISQGSVATRFSDDCIADLLSIYCMFIIFERCLKVGQHFREVLKLQARVGLCWRSFHFTPCIIISETIPQWNIIQHIMLTTCSFTVVVAVHALQSHTWHESETFQTELLINCGFIPPVKISAHYCRIYISNSFARAVFVKLGNEASNTTRS